MWQFVHGGVACYEGLRTVWRFVRGGATTVDHVLVLSLAAVMSSMACVTVVGEESRRVSPEVKTTTCVAGDVEARRVSLVEKKLGVSR